MDGIEDFEFKPITEGLGFHGVSGGTQTPIGTPKSNPGIPSKQPATPAGKIGFQMPEKNFSAGVTARNTIPSPTTTPKGSPILPPMGMPAKSGAIGRPVVPTVRREIEKGLEHDIRQSALRADISKKVSVVPGAIFFDALFVVGLSCFFLVIVLLIAEVDAAAVLASAKTDLMTQLAIVVLGLSVLEFYTIVLRSVFGATLGEWAFDVRMGSEGQQQLMGYPLRLVVRAIITAATGFIMLPILSGLFQKDIAGSLSGVSLEKT